MTEITRLLENTCFNSKCIYGGSSNVNANLEDKHDDLSEILCLLKKLGDNPKLKEHIPCVLFIVHIVISKKILIYKNVIKKQENERITIQNCLLDIALITCKLPDIHYPLKLKHNSESDKEFELNHKLNPKLTQECLKLYTYLLSLGCDEEDDPSLSSYCKLIMKRTCVPMMVLICGRLGNFGWSNEAIKSQGNEILNCIKKFTRHRSIGSLLSGDDSDVKSLFPKGILGGILDELSLVFQKERWNKNLPWKHSFIWCVTKVKYPHLGEHVPKLVPFLLLMLDDFVEQNKLFGISTLLYVIDNVNASDMNLYNHSKVIFETLYSQLFTSGKSMYEVLLPCLHKIVRMIEPNPGKIDGITWTIWDQSVEKVVQNIEFANHIDTRRILLKHLPLFIDDMKVNTGKHLDSIFKAIQFVLQFPDVQEEMARVNCLNVVKHITKTCWIFMPQYQTMLLKLHMKLFVDVKSSDAVSKNVLTNIEEKIVENLILLRVCCKTELDKLLKDAINANITTCCGKAMQVVLKRVLDNNISDTSSIS